MTVQNERLYPITFEGILSRQIPSREWFDSHRVTTHIDDSRQRLYYHDQIHDSTVMVFADEIGRALGFSERVRKVLLYSADLHDFFRVHDSKERGHGQRAAEFVEQNGSDIGIEEDLLLPVAGIVRFHDWSDKDLPPMDWKMRLMIAAFKDSDRYDRVRTGDLDDSRLTFQSLKPFMLPFAQRMHGLTRSQIVPAHHQHDLVMQAGRKLGRIRK